MHRHLYLVRHGIALDIGEAGIQTDAGRTLSPAGLKRSGAAARGLRVLGVCPATIGTSPLPRAEQTARIFGGILTPEASIVVCDWLKPGADLRSLLDWIRHERISGDIMLVGHMPDVAVIAARLVSPSGTTALRFGKAAVCCIRFDGPIEPGRGLLDFHLQSAHLRAIG